METSNPKKAGLINLWATGVPTGLKKSNKPASIHSIPSLTIGSTRSTLASVLTNRVAITSTEPQVINISDEDETKGPEWNTAVASQPKGKKSGMSSIYLRRGQWCRGYAAVCVFLLALNACGAHVGG